MPRLIVIDNLPNGTSSAVEDKTIFPFWAMEDGHQTSELWYLDRVPSLANLPRDFQTHFDFSLHPGAIRFGHSVFPPFSHTKICYQHHGVTADTTTYGKHNTKTIDFLVLTKGTLDLVTDNGTVHLQVSDCIVQKATVHAWINPGNEVAELVYVMIGALVPENYQAVSSPSPLALQVEYPPKSNLSP